MYVVVRKGYEHPEIVAKYVSAIFDQSRYANDSAAREVNDYFSINVDPTARPLNINVDYEDALYRTTEHIQAALDKTLDVSELSGLEKSYFNTCKSYLNGQLTTANGTAEGRNNKYIDIASGKCKCRNSARITGTGTGSISSDH